MLTTAISGLVRRRGAQLSIEERKRLIDRAVAFQTSPLWVVPDFFCSLLFGSNLKMLATIYLSDKWNSHWYAQHYETHFARLRRQRINILEIGIGGYDDPHSGGGSLRMWRTFFPNGRVYGLDIFDKSPHDGRRIKTFRGSQVDPDFLDSVVKSIGRIDIVVDDGSHQNEHVLFTFRHLFPHLADGGIYAIEDTQTSYWPRFGGNACERNDLKTSIGYFKSLVDGINWEEFPGHYEPSYLDANIRSIAFYHNLVFISKGPNTERGGRPQLQSAA